METKKCITCGVLRHPKSKTGNCKECHIKIYRAEKKKATLDKIKKLGYEILSNPENVSHAQIMVKRLSCNHEFTARVNNILTQRCKCKICGPKERMKKCMDGYMKNNARDYDLKKWEDYRNYARLVSNKTYKQNKHILNHQDLPRSKKDYHLDHKVPLIVCFKEGIDPNMAGSLKNLQFVNARENLSKNKHSYDQEVLKSLL